MHNIIGNVSFVQGYLTDGYFEMYLDDEDYEKFKSLSKKDQIKWLRKEGNFEIGGYDLEDCGEITDIEY